MKVMRRVIEIMVALYTAKIIQAPPSIFGQISSQPVRTR